MKNITISDTFLKDGGGIFLEFAKEFKYKKQ
jgi:hypothetical protein